MFILIVILSRTGPGKKILRGNQFRNRTKFKNQKKTEKINTIDIKRRLSIHNLRFGLAKVFVALSII